MEEKHLAIGLVAHVDAGKTTLSEAMLYACGEIRRQGRVGLLLDSRFAQFGSGNALLG